MRRMTSKTIILAAGGTGGHIFPAEALAEVLRARGYAPELVTDHRFHHYNKSSSEGVLGEIPIHTIRAGNLSGGILAKLKSLVGIVRGVQQASRLIKKLDPVAVVGFGGYPSFPTMVAAVLMGRVTILHEQNSVLGRVNRTLAKKVKRIAATYAKMQQVPAGANVVVCGNPVRAAIQALAKMDYPVLAEDGMLRLLVIGGSQGASVFSTIVPQAMALLPESLRARIRLDQQCRAAEIEDVRARYAALKMQVDLQPFFTDMASRLASAHLVISRAGASSVAELMVAGRPAILVPLPSATDNHQYFNAEAIEDKDAGWVVTQDAFTPEALANKLETLLSLPRRLGEMAANMHALGVPNAASKLADIVLEAANVPAPNGTVLENAA
jgi:UDP-N-acetylglucosamine--N-acetylmuramyl-(pentapeptide) pyrophosphoryl-undecaprenol N-acetylglucosamine transferase